MNKRKVLQLAALMIMFGLVAQTGVFAYSKTAAPQSQTPHVGAATNSSSKSQVVHGTFEQFLEAFNVQEAYRQKIDQLIAAGYSRTDICIAYNFLYHNFGNEAQWDNLLAAKASGTNWEQIFVQYNKSHPKFTPRAFDSEELENLLEAPGFTSDDIMIADRLSFVTDKPFKEIINKRMENGNWEQLFVREKVLYSGNPLPRVQITENELRNYTQSSKLSEQQVTRAFVLAQKVGESPKVVIGKLQQGFSEEQIMAQSYTKKYGE